MKEARARVNGPKIAAWNAQLEQDREEQEDRDRLAQGEEDDRQTQKQREAEEQRRKVKRKKPKLNTFDRDREVDDWIEATPAQYALNKIGNLEHTELVYFTIKGCHEAGADTYKSISHDTLAFTQVEGTIAIRSLAAIPPSISDEDLSLDAKNTMLHFMALSGVWPQEHAESLATFHY